MLKGIDISNWQAGINPGIMQIDFAIVKATEGIGFVDWCCDGFVQSLKSNHKLWGFYHFSEMNDPVREADFFVDNTADYFGDGLPVLDYEVHNANDREWAEMFLYRVHERTGIWAMLYTSASWLQYFEGSWIPKKCGLWLAGYPYPATDWRYDDPPYSTNPWEFCAIWQFTSSLQLKGWNNNLDGDIAYMDENAWAKYVGSTDTPMPKPEPEPIQPVLSQRELILQILDGQWGNGSDRYRRLQDAGYDADYIQAVIDEYYEIAYEVIRGVWGNGSYRKQALENAGYDYEIAQTIVNVILESV